MMRTATTLALLLALALASPAGAQTFYCDRPARPHVIVADELTEYEVDQYLKRMREYVDCLQNEASDAASEVNRVIQEWNLAVSNQESMR